MCNQCTARRKDPPPVEKQKLHRYTHALARCTRKAEQSPDGVTPTTEDRMSALEETVWMLTGKIERMEATLSRVERLLLCSLSDRNQASASAT
ncbi:uncharacterized protein PHACADRAFT_252779 [Phanerochaete carnosa HHB-10118-sp]|uniref:Uncharacterized protein n=1 Tax=Phanerochaete carnosa (strain HHB-10118-sp) TaxID=650164 RepID=K5WGK5_PHACS|nr:uncharacterized protein PHACADRAFT_252779 [Phanerochaete carnosa HHB-10118-sp]EKM58450.1 hypothetical protein PHACADRAFT_252779 [Phanerochaete carnosa HHB-10118-sp]